MQPTFSCRELELGLMALGLPIPENFGPIESNGGLRKRTWGGGAVAPNRAIHAAFCAQEAILMEPISEHGKITTAKRFGGG
jgi:hypothetical protein